VEKLEGLDELNWFMAAETADIGKRCKCRIDMP